MSEQENTQLIQAAYDKFNAGDIDGLLGMIAEDVEWVLPDMSGVPFAGIRHGHANVAAFFKSILETFSYEIGIIINSIYQNLRSFTYMIFTIADNEDK